MIKDKIPLGRFGLPEEIAKAVLFLAADGDYITGQQINVNGGRDHYPNNSALVISPRFKRGRVFGKTDAEQLLPAGDKPLSPPDLLATFLAAFKIDHRRYLRDGDVIPEMLA